MSSSPIPLQPSSSSIPLQPSSSSIPLQPSSSSSIPIQSLPTHHSFSSTIPPAQTAFHLPPAVQKTVVTTTTTTTLSFPPIFLPRPSSPPTSLSPHPSSSSKSKSIHQLALSSQDPLPPLDKNLYPLADLSVPNDWIQRGIPLVLSNGAFAKFNPGSAPHPSSSPSSPLPSRKRPLPSRRSPPPTPTNTFSLPPPPRKKSRFDPAAHQLTSHNHLGSSSPLPALPTPLPTVHSPPADHPPATPPDSSLPNPCSPQSTPIHPLHSAKAHNELSTILSLPTLATQFAHLPPAIQQYTLFHLLRHSPVPVLQFVQHLIEPALKRDFIKDLPPELSVLVLSKLDGQSLCRASRVSRTWHELIQSSRPVWRARLVEEDLWIGDGREETDAEVCAMVEAGTSRLETDSFARRWRAGVWRSHDPITVAPTPGSSLPAQPRSPASQVYSWRPEPPCPPTCSSVADPFKLLYRKRFLTRRNWLKNAPRRTSFEGHALTVVTCIQFDWARMVAASDDNAVHSYELRTGRRLRTFVGHQGGVWALQYVGDTLVTGSTDRTVRVWDMTTGRNTHVFHGHTSTVRCLQIVEPINISGGVGASAIWEPAFPVIVTGSRDYTLRVWRLPGPHEQEYVGCPPGSPEDGPLADNINSTGGANPFHLHFLRGHSHAVRALAAKGRTMVSGSYDCTVRAWDIVSGQCTQIMRGHTSKIYSVVLDHTRGRCASGSMDNTVRLWDLTTGATLRVLGEHSSLVGLLGLSPRRLVSAAADATLRIWDASTGTCRHELRGHLGAITCFAHDEFRVVSGADGTLKLWNGQSGELVGDLLTGFSAVWQVGMDERFCVVAVQRGTESEYVVLDYGRCDGKNEDEDGDDDDRHDDEEIDDRIRDVSVD